MYLHVCTYYCEHPGYRSGYGKKDYTAVYRPLINRSASATLLNQIVNFLYRSVHGYLLEIQYIVFKIRHTHVDRLCPLAENSPDALIQNLGVYWIDPDWGSRGNAFQASCNFTLQKTCIKPINPVESNSSKEVCLH